MRHEHSCSCSCMSYSMAASRQCYCIGAADDFTARCLTYQHGAAAPAHARNAGTSFCLDLYHTWRYCAAYACAKSPTGPKQPAPSPACCLSCPPIQQTTLASTAAGPGHLPASLPDPSPQHPPTIPPPLPCCSSSHRSSRSQPVALPGRVARSDNWSRDMQERYGLDTSTFSYDPEQQQAGRQGLGSQQDGPPQLTRSKQSRCVVM